jgi:hypothetical protein
VRTGYERLQAFWDADPETWGFWARWYDGMLRGAPLDWELQRAIALIDDSVWKEGPEAVAQEIAKIEALHRTSVAPRLVRDDAAGLFRVEAETPLPDGVLAFARDRIGLALDAALAALPNGFKPDDYEPALIRAAIDQHPNAPSLLAVSFFDACLGLQKNIGDRYPDATPLIHLQNALYAVVEEICEIDEEAKQRCARLASLQPARSITPEDRRLVPEIAEAIADELDPEARAIVKADVEAIVNAPEPPKSARARFSNWMTTISVWLDRAKKAEARTEWLAKAVRKLWEWWSGSGA